MEKESTFNSITGSDEFAFHRFLGLTIGLLPTFGVASRANAFAEKQIPARTAKSPSIISPLPLASACDIQALGVRLEAAN